ncbi:chaperonin 10-like protein [Mycena sp. CBHHK59/15]|nr:chaperonin 10-like protein [Mycena sp. CBHHK59/15]
MSTHTAIAAVAKGKLDSIEVPTAAPGEGSVRIQVAYASLIAFDTYVTDLGFYVQEWPSILGLNAAGTVVEVGVGVSALAVGDRVTAFSVFGQGLQRTMQESVVLPAHSCAKIPDSLDLAAAATVPDNFITAFYTLFDQLALPVPAAFPAPAPPPDANTPILIYGAGATTGQYAIQLLHAAGYTNVLATASPKHHAHLRALGAARVVDYASPTLAADLGPVELALDAVTAEGTIARVAQVLSPRGAVALLLPIKAGDAVAPGPGGELFGVLPETRNPFPDTTRVVYVRTFLFRENAYLRDNLMPTILPQLLAAGLVQPNRVRLLDQGTLLERVAEGLDLLRNNKVSGEKIIVKVA